MSKKTTSTVLVGAAAAFFVASDASGAASCPKTDAHCVRLAQVDGVHEYYCRKVPGASESTSGSFSNAQADTFVSNHQCKPLLPNATTGSADLAYFPITLLYAPPGNQSETDYMAGSTTGSQTSIQNAFKGGIQGGSTGTLAVQVGYSVQATTGSSFEVDKESSNTLSLSSQTDFLDHAKDEFVLWTNPELLASQMTPIDVAMSLAPKAGQPMKTVRLNLGEVRALAGRNAEQFRATLPPWKRDAIAKITIADFAQIVQLHPYGASRTPTLDPHRFQLVESLQLDGPDQPGDPIPGIAFEITNTEIQGSLSQTQASLTVSVTVTSGFNLFGVVGGGGSIGGNFEYDITNATQTTSAHAQQASVKLQTSTTGFHNVVDVYYDSLFRSFLYVADAPPVPASNASIDGRLLDASGRPLVHQLVTVTMPNGARRRLGTDSRGNYRVFNVGAGRATVVAGGTTHQIAVTPGTIAHVPLPTGASPIPAPVPGKH
jgi:hypothetical protein